ncbi:MAG: LLM class flavin-dependent oxidoreductase [Thaumarchaeota archaeon]|nr:LLM class flavin-dependent oxidoreductase [Nitrososphaerota archaeon]
MKIGVALRSTVFDPRSIAKLVPVLEESGVDSVWFPSVGPAFDCLDMCGISLGATSTMRVGTGVIKPTTYAPSLLLARLHTLYAGSGGRFILGLGTGSSIGASAIEGLAALAKNLREGYAGKDEPPIYFAALRARMLRAAYAAADGAILNFCSPSYVRSIKPKGASKDFTLACYVKLFFAEREEAARRMLVDEMKTYNSFPAYHAMFDKMGASDAIEGLDSGSTTSIPKNLLEISLANPDVDEVSAMLRRFVGAGVDLPIIYPYVTGGEEYKVGVVERLAAELPHES